MDEKEDDIEDDSDTIELCILINVDEYYLAAAKILEVEEETDRIVSRGRKVVFIDHLQFCFVSST